MTLTWQAASVILAILTHAGFLIWWASKMTSKMDTQTSALIKIDRELEKRDQQLAAAWKKLDKHEHRLTVVETKCKISVPEEA